MSIGAMEDRGDDYTSTDHHDESQDFDDLADDEAHDGRASKQDHGSPHHNANPRVLTQTSDHCCDPPTVITTYLHRWSLALFTVGKTPNSGHTTVSKPSDHC